MRPIGSLQLILAACLVITAIRAQTPETPDWQVAAGGKMSFEVASIKPAAKFAPPSFPLSAEEGYIPGSRLTATFPLSTYITFAYKLWLSPGQMRAALANVPKWVSADLYEIRAEAAGSATKDQMRLMMQSLLTDRFNLKVHFETHEMPVLALTLEKPGKLGPRLRHHSEGPPCPESQSPVPASRPTPPKEGDAFPAICEAAVMRRAGQVWVVGSRDTTMQLLAMMVQNNGSMAGEVTEPVVDQTGLTGRFDYAVEYSGQFGSPSPPGADVPVGSQN